MAKGKKSAIIGNEKKDIDFGETQSFLGNAIADISGYIRFLDTKVSIIMAALGVIIVGIINCRNIIFETYRLISNSSLL